MEINLNKEQVVEQGIFKFDPSKNYDWTGVSFNFSDAEFAILYRHAIAFLSNPITPSTIIMIRDMFGVINNKLKDAVESGQAKEMKTEDIVSTEGKI